MISLQVLTVGLFNYTADVKWTHSADGSTQVKALGTHARLEFKITGSGGRAGRIQSPNFSLLTDAA